MDIATARQKLTEKRQWWEATADHMIEQAMLDSESGFYFCLALRKLQAIARNEKRLAMGTFGRCERCGALIDDDRLAMILDDEFHYCVACAAKSTTPRTRRTPVRQPDAHRIYPQLAGAV